MGSLLFLVRLIPDAICGILSVSGSSLAGALWRAVKSRSLAKKYTLFLLYLRAFWEYSAARGVVFAVKAAACASENSSLCCNRAAQY